MFIVHLKTNSMKKSLIAFILFVVVNKSYGQFTSLNNPDKFFIGYEVGFPTNDFVKDVSWRGGRIEYRRMIKPNLSVGIAGSWNSFETYTPRTTYQKADGSGALTTDAVKEIYTVPLTLSAHYYFKGGKKITPYAGVGLGTEYSDQNIYFNIYSVGENNWGFVARPEIGAVFSFNDMTGIFVSGAYNFSTNSNDAFKIDNLSHFAITVGFAFSAR